MKKFIVLLISLFISQTAFAGLISYTTLSSDAGISYTHFNDSFTTVYNEINGSIDTDNLAEGAVTSEDISTNTSPLVREAEHIGEYVYTGFTLPSSGAFVSYTVGAGTAYVQNDGDATLHRVVKDATNIGSLLSATSDNWIFLDFAGAYTVTAVAVDATQPTTPGNSIVLGFVTTNATDATASNTGARQTSPPGIRIFQDYVTGLIISRDEETEDILNILRGEIDLGGTSKVRRNTLSVDVDFGTTGFNGLDTGISKTANTYYYIYAVPSSVNSTGIQFIADTQNSSTAIVLADDERLVGWCWMNGASEISVDSVGAYKGRGSSTPNVVSLENDADMIETGTEEYRIIPGLDGRFYCSGGRVRIDLDCEGDYSNGGQRHSFTVSVDNAYVMTKTVEEPDVSNFSATVHMSKVIPLDEGTYNIVGKYANPQNGQTMTWYAGKQRLIIEEL